MDFLCERISLQTKMKRLFLLVPLFTFALAAKSQIDYRIETYLDRHDIDTFLIYELECSGYVELDSCQFDEPHYLFWRQNENFYLKRFDYCKEYRIISLDTANCLIYYLKNKRNIDKEEVKQPTYYETKKIKGKTGKVIVTSERSHPCYHKFRLSREPEYKYADTYDLDFKEFDNGRKNINYSYNQNTKFKKLIDLTTTLLQTLERENRFEVE
jgi:hypothetical protein